MKHLIKKEHEKPVAKRGHHTLLLNGLFIDIPKQGEPPLLFQKRDSKGNFETDFTIEIFTLENGDISVESDWFQKEFVRITDVVRLLLLLKFEHIGF